MTMNDSLLLIPLERVRILLECEHELLKRGKLTSPFTDEINCFFRIIDNEGVTGLWRGTIANLFRTYTSLIIKQRMARRFFVPTERGTYPKKLLSRIAYTTLPEILSLLFSYPFEFARTGLALDVPIQNQRQYTGTWNVLSNTYYNNSFLDVYTGFGVAAFEIIACKTASILISDAISALVPSEVRYHPLMSLGRLLCCSIPVQVLTHPLEVVRRRMILQVGESTEQTSNPIDLADTILTQEGEEALFKGVELKIVPSIVSIIAMELFRYLKTYK